MIQRKGVCYDVGRVLDGHDWRPMFDPLETRRELEIIRDDLHCTAVKIHAEDVSRVTTTAEYALELGLEAWLAPDLWDHDADGTLAYTVAAARAAEDLRAAYPDRVFLQMGSELSLFMLGIVPGNTITERIGNAGDIRSDGGRQRLAEYLERTMPAVRDVFAGPVTYASLLGERVDWQLFDFVCVDLYRDAAIRELYPRMVERFCSLGRPMIIGEFGCCTYRGAAAKGGNGWDIFDHTVDPPRLNADYTRDEGEQARELTDCLTIFDQGGVNGAFVQTFVSPINAFNSDPKFDFDLGSYSLVRSDASRIGRLPPEAWNVPWDTTPIGRTYPDMPWEPKESFHAIADYYGR